jgi:hypothetical protein
LLSIVLTNRILSSRDNNLPSSLPLPVSVSARGSNSVETDADLLPVAATATTIVSSQTRRDITHIIRDAGFRSAIDSDLALSMPIPENPAAKRGSENAESEEESSSDSSSSSEDEEISSSPPEAVVEEKHEDTMQENSAPRGELQNAENGEDESSSVSPWSSVDDEFSSSPPEATIKEKHESSHNDTADKMELNERDGMAADMEDSGFQMNIDDSGDIDMGGGDDLNDKASSDDSESESDSVSDNSDDGIPLPKNNGGSSTNNNETGHIEIGSVEGATRSYQENPSYIVRDATASTPVPPENTIKSEANVKSQKGKEKEKVEDKSFLSTTLRDGDSHLQDSFVTASAENESEILSSDYSDAISTVQNPFYERDRMAMKADGQNAEETNQEDEEPSLPMHNSKDNKNKPADPVTQHAQSIEQDEQEQQYDQLDDNPGWLDQGDDDNHNVSDSSDPDFPSVEVLWASTAPSQEPFPPIKTERYKRPSSGNNNKASSLQPRQSMSASRSSPAFKPLSSTSTNNNTPATTKKKQSRVVSLVYRTNKDKEERREKSSSFVPFLETGSEQPPSSSSKNQNRDSYLAEDANDQLQQDQEKEQEEREKPPPMTIDLTLSSPLVSPVDVGSDEDFARSQGLPKGPGWVRKNVPSTQRQTRSSTGGGILLSSSPPRPVQQGRRGRQTR